jgi:FecR protein
MTARDDIPIEPLSDASWKRIERAVFDELDAPIPQRRRAASKRGLRWTFVLGGLFAAQAAAALVYFAARTEPAERASLEPVVVASGREPADTMFGDVAIRLEPNSNLLVVKNAGAGSLVVLERGGARFSVPPRAPGTVFVVQAGDVRVEVVGTRFHVRRANGSASVDVEEGKVRVVQSGQVHTLGPGDEWPVARVEPAPAGEAERAAVEADPAAAVEADRAAADEARQAAAREPERGAEPRLQPSAAGRLARTVASSSAADRFERASRLESQNPAEALTIYRSLAAAGGRWGENAAYAMARLELDRGRRAEATRLLKTYLSRHPNGANASDARSLLERLAREP